MKVALLLLLVAAVFIIGVQSTSPPICTNVNCADQHCNPVSCTCGSYKGSCGCCDVCYKETKNIALNSLGSFIYYDTIVNTNMTKIFYVKENEANGEDATWQKNKCANTPCIILHQDICEDGYQCKLNDPDANIFQGAEGTCVASPSTAAPHDHTHH